MGSFEITTAKSTQDIEGILSLQKKNLPRNISAAEAASQGFVTVDHDHDILAAMNQKHPHIIAKADNEVVAYALIMLREFADRIPVLVPMFERIEQLFYQNEPIRPEQYFIMGQVCVAKSHRSMGVFPALYNGMQQQMKPHFDYIITEIAAHNTRSIRAHEKVGFETIDIYPSQGVEWHIVILPLRP